MNPNHSPNPKFSLNVSPYPDSNPSHSLYIYIYIYSSTTKRAREFKEVWHSIDRHTINRHIEIPNVCNIYIYTVTNLLLQCQAILL